MTDNAEAAEKRILHRIGDMVADEKRLRAQIQASKGEEEHEKARADLHALEVELDQCWDLLRQRRALSESGGDPAAARVRPADEVEGYLS
ncbi:hypothetical protein Afil01_59280 [Actinorhabdospora filicis]|uniref:DUF2630 family protein n=1 Tax=Actinorhabdospora filicis TaxID=1785913 RepID=A0A9W6SRN5_9ACTN|nr:DUF2630 family protein [Actinorhabdospora filicis]GLZ81121.1 hypothetical protein Afil01_59280 [Actinorhabdospora filicis]